MRSSSGVLKLLGLLALVDGVPGGVEGELKIEWPPLTV